MNRFAAKRIVKAVGMSLLTLVQPLVSFAVADEIRGSQQVELFYLDFDAATYVAMTRERIEQEASCQVQLVPKGYQSQSLQLLLENSAEPGRFDNKVVRAKIVGLAGGTIFLDQDGGVYLEDAKREQRLSATAFIQMKALLDALCDRRSVRGGGMKRTNYGEAE